MPKSKEPPAEEPVGGEAMLQAAQVAQDEPAIKPCSFAFRPWDKGIDHWSCESCGLYAWSAEEAATKTCKRTNKPVVVGRETH